MRKVTEKRKRSALHGRTGRFGAMLMLLVAAIFTVQQGVSQEVPPLNLTGLAVMPEAQAVMLAGWRDGETILEQRTLPIADNLSGSTIPYELEAGLIPAKVQVSPDERYIAVSSTQSNEIRLYSTGFAAPVATFSGQRQAAFHPDNQTIAVAGDTGGIRLLSLETGDITTTLALETAVGQLAISPDGQWLAASILSTEGAQVQLWQTADLSQVARQYAVDNFAYDMQFSPDSRHLALALDGRVQLLDLEEDAMRFWDLDMLGRVNSVAISPDGAWIAAGGDAAALDDTAGVIAVWRLPQDDFLPVDEDYYAIKTLTGHAAPVSAVAFSWEEARLFSVSADSTVRLWDVENTQEIAQLAR